MTQTDALPQPLARRSFAGRENEVNRYYASRPARAGRRAVRRACAGRGYGAACAGACAPTGSAPAVTAARSPTARRPYFRAPRSSVTAACSACGVATDAAIGSPTASVSRLITPRLIGRGIRASVWREK